MSTHVCPGCGRPGVPQRMYACRVDWYRLPREIRNAISAAFCVRDLRAHVEAMAEAAQWYRDNPPKPRANPDETRGAALRAMRGELPEEARRGD